MIDITEYGYQGTAVFPGGDIPARILAAHRDRYELVCAEGVCHGFLRRGHEFGDVPTTGDYVRITYNPAGDSVIRELLPRKSAFIRTDSWTGKAQAVAANFDTVLIVTSLNSELNPRRLERYIAQACECGARAAVVLTKLDLCPDPEPLIAAARAAAGDAPVIPLSSITGEGLDALAPYAAPGMTVALVGSSGVGKSTLTNALGGASLMKTGAIREEDAHGRHTTTYRQLIMLDSGVMVIDTPGMRNLGLWDSADGVDSAFSDISALESRCRFRDCTHTGEPGCALIRAAESGEIDPQRLKSYLKLRSEARASAARLERARRREKKNGRR